MSSIKDHPVVRTALAVQKRYKADAADQLAAAIGFFGFLSLVPLLLLAVAAAGFIYADPDEQARVALALTEALPGFQATMGDGDADTGVASLVDTVVRNRGTVGLVGVLTLLLTGQRVIAAGMAATRVVFRGAVVSGVKGWLKKFASMVVLGVTALIAVAGSSLAGFTPDVVPGPIAVVIGLAVAFVFDLALFLAAYRMLSTTTSMRLRQLLPGAIVGAIGWAALKTIGATYVGSHVDNANALYGALGGVIALLLLLYLAGRLYLYGAELSAVLVEARDGPLQLPADDADDEDAASDGPTGAGDPAVGDRGGTAADRPDPAGAGAAGAGAAGAGSARRGAGPRGARTSARRTRSHPGSDGDDGPPPIPRRARALPVPDPGSSTPATTAGADTRTRLEMIEAQRVADEATADRGQQARTALAFGLAAAAIVAGWRLLGPDRGSD